ncbi:MAG: E3 binding domain-containing protein, partial [Candidatus Eremiobacteraeota bacterium]|nr:E3 binding domain-containing protein [Candidatus Eremiobacteraeota bacterium]
MAQKDLTVPDIGGFRDVPVIEVLVQPGESVEREAPLVTLESDKATMEVPASDAGVIRDVKVKVGDRVSQGTVLATLDAADAQSPTPPAPPSMPLNDAAGIIAGDAGASQETFAPPPPAPTTQTTPTDAARTRVPAPAAAPASASAASPKGLDAGVSANGASSVAVHASPAIRRFARELGVDLGRVRGSGPNGRITRDDVQGFVKQTLRASPSHGAGATGPAPAAFAHLPPWPSIDFAQFGHVERVALSRIQRISGPALARNWVMIPHVT